MTNSARLFFKWVLCNYIKYIYNTNNMTNVKEIDHTH